jgi:hypothetical protein
VRRFEADDHRVSTMLNAMTPNNGPTPVDTLGAILDIAHNPWNNAAGLLDSDGSARATCSAFADPTIKTPEDGLAIDQSGNVWAADDGACSVIEIIGAATPVKTPLQGVPAIP